MWSEPIKNFIENFLYLNYDNVSVIISLILYLVLTILIIVYGGSIWSFLIGYVILSSVLALVGFDSPINLISLLVNFIKDAVSGIFKAGLS